MAFKDAQSIFKSLRDGTVPAKGLEAFAVGIERHRKELHRKLEEVSGSEGGVKFLRGGYGCGKTFMARLLVSDALERRFATSFVVVSDSDFHFYKFDDLYRKVVSGLSTPACPEGGALADILDRWIGSVEDTLIKTGTPDSDPAFDAKVLAKLDERLAAIPGVPADMIRVVRHIFELKQAGEHYDANALVSWLSGSKNVAAKVKALAGVKGEVESGDAMAYLRGILEIVKSAGYAGLVVVIDEAETMLRLKSDLRGKSFNAIRQVVDAAKDQPGLLWVFTGTPTFFDDRQGVKGVEALYSRIKYEELNGVPSLRQPQLALRPFDRDRLLAVALKLRSLHPDLAPEVAEKRLPRAIVEQLVDRVSEGLRADVGVVPRQFLRTLVNILDVLADDPDQDAHALLGFKPENLTPEEEAVLAGRKLDEPPTDDGDGGFGGASVGM